VITNPIESTYFHRVNVYRTTDVVDEWGETVQTRVLVYEKIPCAVSFTNPNDRNKAPIVFAGRETNKLEYHHKLYVNPRYKFVAGDEVEHIETGMIYLIGDPMVYPSHQEIAMLRRWDAI
jgi:hypothetical protein